MPQHGYDPAVTKTRQKLMLNPEALARTGVVQRRDGSCTTAGFARDLVPTERLHTERRSGGARLGTVSDFYCEQVLNGRLAVDVVHEDQRVLAYHHTRPFFSDVHIVVVPKLHVSSLLDPAAEPLLPHLLIVVQHVAAEVLTKHGAARVLTNLGAYQDSKHLHWHVYAGREIAEPTARPSGPSSRCIIPTQ
jgi:histidine triad (HIT) family protein